MDTLGGPEAFPVGGRLNLTRWLRYFNGAVDGVDLANFAVNWAPSGITFHVGDVATVPEPGTIMMLLIGLLLYRKCR